VTAPDAIQQFRAAMEKLRSQGADVLAMTETQFRELARVTTRMSLEAQNARLGWDRSIDEALRSFDAGVEAEKKKHE